MSERPKSRRRKTAESAAVIIGAGAALGIVRVAGITAHEHRDLTHRSVELPSGVKKFLELEQRSLGVNDATVWASVHRIHHQMTDATLYPFYRIKHAIQAAETQGIPVPETFPHLDPFVTSFTRKDVEKIGSLADEEVKKRLGDEYLAPTFTDAQEIQHVLNPNEPTYYYPDYDKKQNVYTPDELAQIFLTDPHSPALVKRTNGVQGVVIGNVGMYQRPGRMFEKRGDLKDKDLQTGREGKERTTIPEVVAGILIPSAIVFLAQGEYTAKGATKALVKGAAINGISAGFAMAGGNGVNAFGHGGNLEKSLTKAALNSDYTIQLNPDGTLATDTVRTGAVGRTLSILTFDEIGGQGLHHKYPDRIAYTDKKGRQAWVEAPWGSFLSYLAHNEKISFIKPGKGFEGSRPDMPHEGVLLIQEAREKQIAEITS